MFLSFFFGTYEVHDNQKGYQNKCRKLDVLRPAVQYQPHEGYSRRLDV